MELTGIVPALTTPFEHGKVAAGRLVENLARYGELPFGGWLVAGSTGEAALLEPDERDRVLSLARSTLDDGRPLVAGVLAESTESAIAQAGLAADRGADAALVITPHYYRGQMTDEAMLAHFERVADRSPIPILLYNVPKFTGVDLSPAVAVRLSRHENVAGMKDSSGDMERMRAVLSAAAPGFRVLCGAAGILAEALVAGAAGAILAAPVAFPEPFLRIAAAVAADNAVDAVERQALDARRVAAVHGIPGLKCAMDTRGLYGGPPRRPLLPVPEAVKTEIEQIVSDMVEAGFLPARRL